MVGISGELASPRGLGRAKCRQDCRSAPQSGKDPCTSFSSEGVLAGISSGMANPRGLDRAKCRQGCRSAPQSGKDPYTSFSSEGVLVGCEIEGVWLGSGASSSARFWRQLLLLIFPSGSSGHGRKRFFLTRTSGGGADAPGQGPLSFLKKELARPDVGGCV